MHPIDGYLLDGTPAKADAIRAALADRSADPRAAAFYRALDAVGARAADEALIALRLVIAGLPADDAGVAKIRALVASARRGDAAARTAYQREFGISLNNGNG